MIPLEALARIDSVALSVFADEQAGPRRQQNRWTMAGYHVFRPPPSSALATAPHLS